MWHVIYYETIDGKCPVMEFIESRGERDQATTSRVPKADLREAKRCRQDFLKRMDENSLKEIL